MSEEKKRKIDFHYIKGNFFRVIHADGVIGGITPSNGIQVSFFNERAPFPTTVTHELDDNGQLEAEVSRVSKSGIIREVDSEIVMSLETAKKVNDWLRAKIEILENLNENPDLEKER